jgi:ribosomal protein L29
MRTEDKKQLKDRSKEELSKIIKEDQEKLRGLRFDFAAGKIKNFSEIWKAKKRIAIAATFLTQKARIEKTEKSSAQVS